MKTLRSVTILAVAAVILATPLAAVHHINTSSGMLVEGGPLALRGYDAVAYFKQGRPVEGSHRFTAVHGGVAYQFASEANKKAFEANPSKYAPAYGGYCCLRCFGRCEVRRRPAGVGRSSTGRLYLNLNPDIQQKWEEDIEGNISKAEAELDEDHSSVRARGPEVSARLSRRRPGGRWPFGRRGSCSCTSGRGF